MISMAGRRNVQIYKLEKAYERSPPNGLGKVRLYLARNMSVLNQDQRTRLLDLFQQAIIDMPYTATRELSLFMSGQSRREMAALSRRDCHALIAMGREIKRQGFCESAVYLAGQMIRTLPADQYGMQGSLVDFIVQNRRQAPLRVLSVAHDVLCMPHLVNAHDRAALLDCFESGMARMPHDTARIFKNVVARDRHPAIPVLAAYHRFFRRGIAMQSDVHLNLAADILTGKAIAATAVQDIVLSALAEERQDHNPALYRCVARIVSAGRYARPGLEKPLLSLERSLFVRERPTVIADIKTALAASPSRAGARSHAFRQILRMGQCHMPEAVALAGTALFSHHNFMGPAIRRRMIEVIERGAEDMPVAAFRVANLLVSRAPDLQTEERARLQRLTHALFDHPDPAVQKAVHKSVADMMARQTGLADGRLWEKFARRAYGVPLSEKKGPDPAPRRSGHPAGRGPDLGKPQ